MELIIRSIRPLDYHIAVIRTPLAERKVIDSIDEVTVPQRSKIGRAIYMGQYACELPFTGIINEKRIDLYWTDPLDGDRYLRILGSIAPHGNGTALRLRTAGIIRVAFRTAIVLGEIALIVAMYLTQPYKAGVITLLIALALTMFLLVRMGRRRREAFAEAARTIAETIASHEPEVGMGGGDRAVSRRAS